jgi:hypothetical protein
VAWRKSGLISGVKRAIVPAGARPRSILTGPFRGIRMNLDLQRDSQIYAGLYEREIFPEVHRLAKGIRTMVDIGAAHKLPKLGSSKVMLHSKVSDPAKRAALRTLAATFRSAVASGKRSVSPA